jgi:hypothetical protein
MESLSLTQGTRRLVRQALERFGLVGALVRRREGLGLSGCLRGRHRALGSSEGHEDKKPEKCK